MVLFGGTSECTLIYGVSVPPRLDIPRPSQFHPPFILCTSSSSDGTSYLHNMAWAEFGFHACEDPQAPLVR